MYNELQIFRPLTSKKLTQHFGENKACVRPNGAIIGTETTCPANTVPFYQSVGMDGHSGIDIKAIVGEDVYHAATYDGWWSTEVDNAGGIGVDVISNEPLFFPFPIPTELINTAVPHTQNGKVGFTHYVKMRYWHLHAPVGFTKKAIKCGTVIGMAGNTGASSAPHLHFAPKWCLIDGRAVGNNNGYYGAFDPTPYYTHDYTALEHIKMLTPKAPVVPLSAVERKDMLESLNLAQRLLLELQKLINKI